ncbi:MAG: hypothetical protein IJL90_02120 [Lachnospiraceae bacterium]|nr:hypothetical protein [Lachnospiraceae bacterium]
MKSFGKFITFVGITGAALAGLWYFCDTNSKKCECSSDDDGNDSKGGERSYVSLDPEEAVDKAKDVAKDLAEAGRDGKETLKKAVKSAAQDIMTKAEDAARGVGIVKDDKKTSDFEFEDFDKTAGKAKKAAGEAAEDLKDKAESVASHIDIQ